MLGCCCCVTVVSNSNIDMSFIGEDGVYPVTCEEASKGFHWKNSLKPGRKGLGKKQLLQSAPGSHWDKT